MDRDIFDDQLDALLVQRQVPEMRSNLAYRIIEASHNVPQERGGLAGVLARGEALGLAFLKGVAGVLDYVVIPKPAFAMAAVVIMLGGVVLGANTGGLTGVLSGVESAASYDSSDVETFIMATDSFEYGDFL